MIAIERLVNINAHYIDRVDRKRKANHRGEDYGTFSNDSTNVSSLW